MEMESLSRLTIGNHEDCNEFDLTVASLLVGLGAEKYIDIFKSNNIGQATLVELSDEDLQKLGVADEKIREKIVCEVQSLPLYEYHLEDLNTSQADDLDPSDIASIIENTSKHLYHIHLSLLSNRIALKKTKDIKDCLLYEDLYASDIALKTIDAISNVLDSMEKLAGANSKLAKRKNKKLKKVIISAVGSGAIVVLAVLFWKSLKNL